MFFFFSFDFHYASGARHGIYLFHVSENEAQRRNQPCPMLHTKRQMTDAKVIFIPQDFVCETEDEHLMYFRNELGIKKKCIF